MLGKYNKQVEVMFGSDWREMGWEGKGREGGGGGEEEGHMGTVSSYTRAYLGIYHTTPSKTTTILQ